MINNVVFNYNSLIVYTPIQGTKINCKPYDTIWNCKLTLKCF